MTQATISHLSSSEKHSPSYEVAPVRCVTRYTLSLKKIPCDFFADPDGDWDYDTLVREAGFDADQRGIAIGALTKPFRGHPAGSAIVTLNAKDRPYVAIIECAPLPDAEQEIGRVLEEEMRFVAS